MGAHTCMWNGCTRPATCAPVLRLPAVGHPIDTHQPIAMMLGLEVCDECFPEITVDHIAPAGMERGVRDIVRILTSSQGRCPVDWDRAFIEKTSLDSDMYRALSKPGGAS